MNNETTKVVIAECNRSFWFGLAWRSVIGVITGKGHAVAYSAVIVHYVPRGGE